MKPSKEDEAIQGVQTGTALGMSTNATRWQQKRLDDLVGSFHRRMKPAKPMVAIQNLSAEFMEMAIRLDVLLCEFRDIYGRWRLLWLECERTGVTIYRKNSSGHKEWVPELGRIEAMADKSHRAVTAMIRTIETTKAVRHGDRVLKKRAADLQCDNWFRQLDWLQILYDRATAERQ